MPNQQPPEDPSTHNMTFQPNNTFTTHPDTNNSDSVYQSLIPLSSQEQAPEQTIVTTKTIHAVEQLPHFVKAYDCLPPHIQSSTLFDLLQRSNKSTLQYVNSLVMPILKRDFLVSLPYELKIQVIGYLDVQSLCIASSVSKTWQLIIDGDKNTWYRLLQNDGFEIPATSLSAKQLKSHYRHQYTLKMNWKKGQFKRVEFEGHSNHIVTCLQFDQEKIVSGATDAMINIYDTQDPTSPYVQLQGHAGGVWALQYLNNTLVSGSIDRTVRVWNIKKRKCTHIFKGHTSTVRCLQIVEPVMIQGRLQPSQPLIVTGSRDFSIRVWTLPDVEEEQEEPFVAEGSSPWFKYLLIGHSHSVRSIAAHGNTLVSGSYDNTVAVWDLSTGRMVHRMEGHTSNVYSVVIDPIRQQCMSGSMDQVVYVWDLVTGECLHKLDGHSVLVGLLGLTPNHLVSASADRTLRVWDPTTGVCQHVLAGKHGHEGAITCFKHDEEKVISGSEGGLKMWDIKTGRYLYDLVTDVKGVWWVTFDKSKCVVAIHNRERTSFQLLDFDV
ncbi:WD40-repeat-containing domain protein [Gilbertella persicaria]|uniref:WD40-repeat-containing domain protein n=1 Tax=Gilbertella persicaria TaxID=101096 RepID=UPI00221FB500|nr:WD40-repeat-containing domain protein [Gilbertella persicaria]KAI8057541.1 WD40-repeat-containing domain protein [Gilbertella persicaria]